MKCLALVIGFLSSLMLTISSHTQKDDFPVLRGPYLGQKPPGMKPELFAPGVISTGLEEGLCTFMPGGNEIIYVIVYRKPHSPIVYTALVRSRVVDGFWSAPEVMDFSGDQYACLYPFITYNGQELFFQTNRPTNRPELKDEYNIWHCRRIGAEWSEPEPLPPPINGRGNVSGPSISLAGEFYFTLMSGRLEKDGIYRSQYREGKFSEPERLPVSLNVKQGSFDGAISPDGSYYLVNVYNKEDSIGETDLYVSFRNRKGGWTPLQNLGREVNTPFNEGAARVSHDGQYIFFDGFLVSHRFFSGRLTYTDILNNRTKPQYGNSDIYWVSAKIIEELRPKGIK